MLAVVVIFLVLLLNEVIAQTTHVVEVGVEGSFYSPPTISAGLNDTVLFVFGGDAHTVTQSSFDSPCVRLDGGFDSGFNGRGADFSNPTPVWALRITNVSEPIWFFCEASVPTSHCESGMVGAINPPSILMYDQFVSAAKLVTSTPKPTPSFIASGQGALATNSPIPSSIPQSADPFSFPDTSSPTTTAISATSTAPSGATRGSPSHVTLIAACATAGGVVVLVLIVLTIFHCRRWRAYREAISPIPADGRNSGQAHDKSPELTSTNSGTAATHTLSTMRTTPNAEDFDKNMDAPSSSPSRTVRPLPRAPSHNQLRQPALNGGGNAVGDPPAPHVDINTLAMEVASVLLHTPPRPVARQHPDPLPPSSPQSHRRRRDESGWYEDSSGDENHRLAPPHYRAT